MLSTLLSDIHYLFLTLNNITRLSFVFHHLVNIYLVSYKQILNFNNSPYLLKTEIKKYFQHFFNELHSFGNRNVSLKLREDCSFRFINSEGRQVNEVGEE